MLANDDTLIRRVIIRFLDGKKVEKQNSQHRLLRLRRIGTYFGIKNSYFQYIHESLRK